MDSNEYLKREFLAAWKEKTGSDFSGSLTQVERTFSIRQVNDSVNRRINESADKLFSERYQRNVLRTLTKLYVEELFTTSNSGRVLNESTLFSAKTKLKSQGRCEVQPC